MIYGHFYDPGSVRGGVDRQKAVHFAVKPYAVDHMALIGLHRTAKIVKPDSRDRGNQSVRKNAWNISPDVVVLPVLSPSGNHVVSLVEQVEHLRNIGRIVLAVAIQRNNRASARMIESGHHRRRLSLIALEMNDTDMLIFVGNTIQYLLRSIGAAVIN